MKPHKVNDMPCRPSFIESSFDFHKTGPGSTMYILMQFLKVYNSPFGHYYTFYFIINMGSKEGFSVILK